MKRRTILKSLVAAFAGVSAMRLPLANASDYRGKLFVFVQADGGWDPTSFCDPKANTLGERAINHWAEYDEIRQAGNIRYAPFGRNKAFFEKYYDRMLVINGVDAQTNSHTVGVVHNWSGRNSEGYPTTTALLAAYYAPAAAAPYLSFGGFSVTSWSDAIHTPGKPRAAPLHREAGKVPAGKRLGRFGQIQDGHLVSVDGSFRPVAYG